MKLTIHIDGGSRGNPGPAGAGIYIQNATGESVVEAGFFLGRKTNNQAEYTALLKALEWAAGAGARELEIFSDSELLVRQINGEYRVKNAKLKGLHGDAASRLETFRSWKMHHVRRENNQRADQLANDAMDAGEDVMAHNSITTKID